MNTLTNLKRGQLVKLVGYAKVVDLSENPETMTQRWSRFVCRECWALQSFGKTKSGQKYMISAVCYQRTSNIRGKGYDNSKKMNDLEWTIHHYEYKELPHYYRLTK